jgi:hypothetical protein
MASEIIKAEGAVVRIRISGIMRVADLRKLQTSGLELIRQGNKLRLLVLLEDFQGWEQSGDWADTGFMPDQDRGIHKIAIVGDEQWRDQTCAFVAQGLRPFAIEYFALSAQAEAERWLQA